MSAHVEWLAALVEHAGPGEFVGGYAVGADGNDASEADPQVHALVIGGGDNMAVVEGTADTLQGFALAALAAVPGSLLAEFATERAELAAEAARINDAEEHGQGVSSSDWQALDDRRFRLLDQIAAYLRLDT